MVKLPLGLFTSEATFAKNLLYEIPAEAVNSHWVLILDLISSAIRVAEGFCFLLVVTSK